MKMPMHTSGELFDYMLSAFCQHNMEQAEAETCAIMAELLDCNRLQAKLDRERPLTSEIFARGVEITARRLNNEPWQYIFKRAYFRDLVLEVTPDVLIPRPETELLVEWCINNLPENGALLDVGTGSGAIALSVAQERRDSQVTACDISIAALNTASRNAMQAGLSNVKFEQSDLLSNLPGRKFDIIAANLPYVTFAEYSELPPEVKNFEPQLALTANDNGLELIKKLILQTPELLSPRGGIILEMSPTQTAEVSEFMAQSLNFCAIEIIRDYTGRERFVAAGLRC